MLSECVAVLKSLPVLHHGADYSVWSLGSMTSFWALSNILLKELQLCIYNNCSWTDYKTGSGILIFCVLASKGSPFHALFTNYQIIHVIGLSIDCGVPSSLPNSTWTGSTTEGSVVTYMCNNRYELSPTGADTTITCQESGTWTDTAFTCEGTYNVDCSISSITNSHDMARKTWARPWENVSYVKCEQQRRRSACASAQSDQRLCCSLLR